MVLRERMFDMLRRAGVEGWMVGGRQVRFSHVGKGIVAMSEEWRVSMYE